MKFLLLMTIVLCIGNGQRLAQYTESVGTSQLDKPYIVFLLSMALLEMEIIYSIAQSF